MPRVKVPRCARLLKLKLQGGAVSTHAPAKTVAVKKLYVGQGAVIQNKAGAYTQLQEGSSQNKRVTGTGLKCLLVERPGSFAAAPYLLRRNLQHGAAAPYVKPAAQPLPSPSFASRPVWREAAAAAQQTPQEKRQAAIEARLARLPLYTYAQLSSRHGVQKQSRRSKSSSVLSASEQQGLAWYDTLGSERRRAVHMPATKPRQQRQGLIWYNQLSRKSKPSLQQSQQRSS